MREAEERAFRHLVKRAKLPGFRPGKAPRKIFEQAYGPESISSQAMEDVLPVVYAKAVREHGLSPVDRPKMEVLPARDGEPIAVKATVEVRPQFDLAPYRGMAIPPEAVEVTDEDVAHALGALAREHATLIPAEREAREGDVATLDYSGTVDGTAFEGGTASGAQTELSQGRFIPGFIDGILGMKPGEHRTVPATFPVDYPQKELAGKAAAFEVTLRELKERELPALDDEFAQRVSKNATVSELRADVRARLIAAAQARAKRRHGDAIVEALIAAHDIPLPEVLVEREIAGMLSDTAGMAARVGTSFEEYLEALGKSEESLRAEYRGEAQKRVKGTLILEAIAKQEKIEATPADIQMELTALARQYGQPVDRIRAALGNNVLSLMDGIVRTKTLEFLIENARTGEIPEQATPSAPS